MKNPIVITIEDDKHVEIGDPFILRFNGKYYLYPSTCDEVEGVRCFISNDLINYKYYGLVAESPLLSHAYAPEVIYKDGEFIMCTSPKGNGHYFLKSKSPLGPFEFISDNVCNMIDGSFVIDRKNNLHFIRADHNGIAYLDYLDTKLINRKDILPQISKAWTEGPSITYYNGYYYATYCGNDVLSDTYRIKVATSKYIDKYYKTLSSPLLISLEEGFKALGHNSVVLGPSLDEYYVAYHKLDWIASNRTTRYLCIDRLYFNKRDCCCNYSNFIIDSPKLPDFECDVNVNNKLQLVGDLLLSPTFLLKGFTAEFNFKNNTTIILSYTNETNYFYLSFSDYRLEIYQKKNNKDILIKTISHNFKFNCLRCIRIINGLKKCEVLIDNVLLTKLNPFDSGKIGYVNKNELYYFAYTNAQFTSSYKEYPIIIPGKLEANYTINNIKLRENEEEIDSVLLKPKKAVTYNVTCKKHMKYKIFSRMKNNNCKLLLKTKTDNVIVNVNQNECEYNYSLRYLGEIEIDTNDNINIEVLEGVFEYQYLVIQEQLKTLPELLICDEEYMFANYSNNVTLEFILNSKDDVLFGLIINAINYSNWRSNKDFKYMGYFVGFDGDLLIVDYCQYDKTRIYDKPYRLNIGDKYKLNVKVLDNILKVYINEQLVITTSLKYDNCHGYSGVYKNKITDVLISLKKEG